MCIATKRHRYLKGSRTPPYELTVTVHGNGKCRVRCSASEASGHAPFVYTKMKAVVFKHWAVSQNFSMPRGTNSFFSHCHLQGLRKISCVLFTPKTVAFFDSTATPTKARAPLGACLEWMVQSIQLLRSFFPPFSSIPFFSQHCELQ